VSLILSRRDIDFLLFEWLKVENLAERRQFSGQDRYMYADTLDVYEVLAANLFAPHNKKNDNCEPQFVDGRVQVNPEIGIALAAFADAGLVAAGMPVERNGLGLPQVVASAGMAFLLAANIATASYAFLTIGNANLLLEFGTDAQLDRFLPEMIAGRCFGTMCLSEPQAGSSLADIQTRAVPDGTGTYRLFGNKMWISGGEHDIAGNIAHLVLAKIPDPQGRVPAGVQGISLFLVPRRLPNADGSPGDFNDIALAGINHKMGYRGTVNCLLNFGEGRYRPGGRPGAVGELVGGRGEGLACMFRMMNEARIQIGLGAAALAYTGYLHALEYARTRLQGRPRSARDPQTPQVPIVRHADVRRMLLAQKTYASGALALCLYAAKLHDDSRSLAAEGARRDAALLLDLLTPVVKSWPSQWGLTANDLAIQVHGGYGYTREYNVEQFYRDNRLNPIHEGTFGIQALDLLGRKVHRDGGAALDLLEDRVEASCAAVLRGSRLVGHVAALQEAWGRIRNVTRELEQVSDLELRLANAVPFLEAFGHLVVAWLWLDQARCAESGLTSAGATEEGFYRGKLAACDYFFGWEVPRVHGWLAVLDPIERTPLDVQEAWL